MGGRFDRRDDWWGKRGGGNTEERQEKDGFRWLAMKQSMCTYLLTSISSRRKGENVVYAALFRLFVAPSFLNPYGNRGSSVIRI